MKSTHLPKIERRRKLAISVLLPDETSRGEVEASGDRLRKLLARLDSTEFGGRGRPESGWRSAARDIVTLLDVDIPELMAAVREANTREAPSCFKCGERRAALIGISPEEGDWMCRDKDGCFWRQSYSASEEQAGESGCMTARPTTTGAA